MRDVPMLGVLGGMGPLAGAQFVVRLTLLTPAARDQDHVPVVLWSDPRVPDRTAARFGSGPDPLPAMRRGLAGLAAAGCGAVAIPCNTAHGWLPQLRAATALPILDIVAATVAELQRLGVPPGPVGLLATEATLAMGLYPAQLEPAGFDCLVPDAAAMAALVSPAIALVKANAVAEAYAPLAEAARGLVARGARAVVLGCTEIPLGIAVGPGLGVPLCDSIDALARAAIAWARGDQGQSQPGVGPAAARTT